MKTSPSDVYLVIYHNNGHESELFLSWPFYYGRILFRDLMLMPEEALQRLPINRIRYSPAMAAALFMVCRPNAKL